MTERAALGFSLHSGWGIVVLVSGVRAQPRLVDRQRVDLEPNGYPVQMFHAASDLSLAEAGRLVDSARQAAETAAREVLEAQTRQAAARGLDVAAIGLAADPRPTLDDLERIMTVHPRMHRAEGDLYRDALVDAAAARALPLELLGPRQLRALAANALGRDLPGIERLLADFGRLFGPPWQQDHKLATLAAIVALLEP